MVVVRDQDELDRAVALQDIDLMIVVDSISYIRLELRETVSPVIVRGDSWLAARGDTRVTAKGRAYLEAYDRAHIVAWDWTRIWAWGDTRISGYDRAHISAHDRSHVDSWDDLVQVVRWGEQATVVSHP